MQLIKVTPITDCPDLKCMICNEKRATVLLELQHGVLPMNMPACASCGRLDMAIMKEVLLGDT